MAVLFASSVVVLVLFLWRLLFHARRPGWFVNILLLVGSGFVAIVVLMVVLFATANRFSKGTERLIEEAVFACVTGALVTLSHRLTGNRKDPK